MRFGIIFFIWIDPSRLVKQDFNQDERPIMLKEQKHTVRNAPQVDRL
jgi:hypothetical protein